MHLFDTEVGTPPFWKKNSTKIKKKILIYPTIELVEL
jgi:hypothetical protein